MVDLNGIDNSAIEDKLFSCGLEVEEKKTFNPEVSGVYVGKVLTIERHPDSDHMFITQVDCGEKGTFQIVTGAQNVHAGDVVPAALDGARVIDRHDAKVVTIKNGKLRGVPSNGMLCSGEELGIDAGWMDGGDVDGILMLDKNAVPGTDVREVLGFNDEIWDISITANLPHCQSVFGIAREIAAQFDRTLHAPDVSFTASSEKDSSIGVTVNAPDLCPRYIAHQVKNVKIFPSPEKIRRRLILCDHNPINNIVDITNYILVELGQPMHAFDMSTVGGRQIIVRRAGDGEPLTTLDGTDLKLTPNNLVICDAEKPVALAGIMGGLNSEIREDTNEVLFEAAKFMRENVRKSSRALGVNSESSHRFEKGVDEYTTEMAMRRALHLIEELGAGTVTATHLDVCADPDKKNAPIETTFDKINGVLGIEVPHDVIVEILKRQNYEIKVDGGKIAATAPAYREDVESFPDLAEDVIKVYGYDHIQPKLLEGLAITAGGLNRDQKMALKCKQALAMQGFFELINYSFYSEAELNMLDLPEDAPERRFVRISNPISENYSIMRTIVLPSVLETVARNQKKGNDAARFFELANVFIPGANANDKPTETRRLSFALYGAGESFFTAKGAVEAIGREFGLNFTVERETRSFLHPGASVAVLLDGKKVGFFGQLSYESADNFEITANTFVGELDYDAIAGYFPDIIKYRDVSKFPEVTRDLALVVEEEKTCGEVQSAILQGCKSLAKAELFDVYRGEQLGAGMKSMAFKLTFVPTDKPFTPEDIDGFVNKIVTSLDRRFGIKMR